MGWGWVEGRTRHGGQGGGGGRGEEEVRGGKKINCG